MDDVARISFMEDFMSDVQSNTGQNNSGPNLVNEWLSVEAAALRLGISSRSIARRIQSGQLESRVDANGRRSVLVCLPAPDVSQRVDPQPLKDVPIEGVVTAGQARDLAQQAMTLVIRSHDDTVLAARAEMFAAQRSTRRAWAAVAILVTHNLTAASALVKQAEARADQAQAQASTLAAERDQLRDQMVQAKVKEAQAQGQLAGMTIVVKTPTTAPASPVQRIASVLFGE
jgi:hypothetical protein